MRQDIIDAVKNFGLDEEYINSKKLKKYVPKILELLKDDETVLLFLFSPVTVSAVNSARGQTLGGIYALTDKRIVIYCNDLGSELVDFINLTDIEGVGYGNKLIVKLLKVHTANKTYSLGIVDAKKYEDEILQLFITTQQNALSASKETQKQQDSAEIMDKIKELFALKEAGILTEEEFTAKKAEMLKRL